MGTSSSVSVGKHWDSNGSVVVLQSEVHCKPMHTPLQHFWFHVGIPPLHLHSNGWEQPAPSLPFSHENPLLTSFIVQRRLTQAHMCTPSTLEHFFLLQVNRTDGAALLSCVLIISCPFYSVQQNQSWFVGLRGCSQRRQNWTKALRSTTAVMLWFITFAPNKEKFTEKVLFTWMYCTKKNKSNETHTHTHTHSHTSVLSQCFFSVCCEVSHQHREA